MTVDHKQQRADSTGASGREQDASPWALGRLEIGSDEVHVWRAPLELSSQHVLALEALLVDGERARADRFVFARDRQRFVVARAALRSILGRYLGRDPRKIEFTYTESGKPELSGNAEALGVRFNLAHANVLALVAVARRRRIGIDIEHLGRNFDYRGVAERFFSDVELRELESADPARRAIVFLECWTEKEAVLKASGGGLGRLSLSFAPRGPIGGGHASPQARGLAGWSIRRLEAAEGYTAALAVEGDAGRVTWFDWAPPRGQL